MQLTQLRLENFRLISAAEIPLAEGANLFVGENAQGKTTVLEAVSYLARGRSFRTVRDRDVLPPKMGEDLLVASTEADFSTRSTPHTIRAAFTAEGKSFFLDSKPLRSLATLYGTLNIVTFIPEDLEIVRGAPVLRRGLIDSLLAQASRYDLNAMQSYDLALRQRNALLRTGGSAAQFDAYEDQMAEHGARLMLAREQLLAQLAPVAAEQLIQLTSGSDTFVLEHETGFPQAAAVQVSTATDPAILRAALAAWWRTARTADADRGFTQQGPHRADLALVLNGRDARAFASQGQARSIVLALRLAERRLLEELRGEAPILLLDDVLGELDLRRSKHFFRLLAQQGVQSLITATDAAPIEAELPLAARFVVKAGMVNREQ